MNPSDGNGEIGLILALSTCGHVDYFNWSMLDGVLWLKSIGGECLDDSALHTPIHDHEFNLRHLYLKPNGLMFLQLPLHRNGEKLHKNQK